MKKLICISLVLIILFASCSCSGFFGHEKYTDISNYSKIFDLSEIRYAEALELFPDDIETLQDMIVAATNEALRQAEEANSALMGKMAGGLGLGGGFPF